MPGGDRTGPRGMGERTGRGLGDCPGDDRTGFARRGLGFGRGRGWRHWARATGLPRWMRAGVPDNLAPDEAALLKTRAEQIKTELENIQQRLNDLEA